MEQFAIIYCIGCMLHIDAIGKEPKLAMADMVVVDMGGGDMHTKNIFLQIYLPFSYTLLHHRRTSY
jgi:hypothetical protein